MVAEGKIKKGKHKSVIFKRGNLHYEKFADGTVKCIEDEIPFDISTGWAWERLSNLATFSGGKTPSTSNRDYWEGNILWVTSKDMKCKYIDSSLLMISEKGLEQMQLYPENTLLLVTRSGILRHTIPVAILKKPATINQDLKAIMPYIPNLEEYILTCIKGMESRLILEYTKAGATVENINFDAFKKILLPIPPESQIQRIISAANNASDIIDNLKTDQEDLIDIISKTKSRLLDLAIRGKLVPQNPDDEPASVLLEHIRAEKEELICRGKIKRDKKESVIFRGEDNSYYVRSNGQDESIAPWELSELPPSWGICTLGEVCDFGSCTNVETGQIHDDDWILDLEDIEKDSGRVLCKVRKNERNSISTKHRFIKGQVLYSKLRPYLNKVVLADEDGYCTSEILPLNFAGIILPAYARYYLMSPTFLKYADRCSFGVKMPRLGTSDGKNAVLTVPPVREQYRIVEAIEAAFVQLESITESLN